MTRSLRSGAALSLALLAIPISACNKEPVASSGSAGRTVSAAPPAGSVTTTAKGTQAMRRSAGPIGAPVPPVAPPGPRK